MTKVNDLWEKLPKFVWGNKTVRAEIKHDSADIGSYLTGPAWQEVPVDKANMITSEIVDDGFFFEGTHRPILDLDYAAELIPSTTPGHFHLYLDRTVSKDQYFKFLEAAANAGIIQKGFYEGAKKRGASSVRLPWIKKGDTLANSGDPDIIEKLQDEIKQKKLELSALMDKLDELEPF